MADIWACVCCSGPGLLKDLRIDRSSLFKTYMELSAANKKLMTVFNCDSSSISHNVCLSVRWVGPQRVSYKCYTVVSVFILFLIV